MGEYDAGLILLCKYFEDTNTQQLEDQGSTQSIVGRTYKQPMFIYKIIQEGANNLLGWNKLLPQLLVDYLREIWAKCLLIKTACYSW